MNIWLLSVCLLDMINYRANYVCTMHCKLRCRYHVFRCLRSKFKICCTKSNINKLLWIHVIPISYLLPPQVFIPAQIIEYQTNIMQSSYVEWDFSNIVILWYQNFLYLYLVACICIRNVWARLLVEVSPITNNVNLIQLLTYCGIVFSCISIL